MKRSPDNQINTSFIDISRIKWLVFLLRSSSAQLDHWQAPKQRPIIDQHPVEQTSKTMDTNGLYKILAGTSKEHVVDKDIRQNPQKSELIHWRQCLLSGATEPCPHGLRETLARIHVIPHNVTPRVACWRGSRPNTQKAECMLRRWPIGRPNKNLRVYTASDANWLRNTLS